MSFGLFLYPVHPNQKSNVRSFVSLVSREFGLIYLNLRLIYKVVMSFYLREFGLIFSTWVWCHLFNVSLVSFLTENSPHFPVDNSTYPREFGVTIFDDLREFGVIITWVWCHPLYLYLPVFKYLVLKRSKLWIKSKPEKNTPALHHPWLRHT